MRQFSGEDAFKTIRLIEKAGVEEELQTIVDGIRSSKIKKAEDAGYKIIFGIMKALTTEEAESDFWKIASDILEMAEEEARKMPIFKLVKELSGCISKEEAEAFFDWFSSQTH